MKKFTFEDYREALEGDGPKLKENILARAEQDKNIEFGAVLEVRNKDLLEPLFTGLFAGPAQHELSAVVGAVINRAATALI